MDITKQSRPNKRSYKGPPKDKFVKDKLLGYISNQGEEIPGAAIISELIQNADDAQATIVKFRFHPDYLEVYNDKYFTEDNFDSITHMLAGTKEDTPGKIGAFGTGFISVFNLTDLPELLSAGEHYFFDLDQDNLVEGNDHSVQRETVFRFPWRRSTSDLARRIGARVWSQSDIDKLEAGLGKIIYPLRASHNRLRHQNKPKRGWANASNQLVWLAKPPSRLKAWQCRPPKRDDQSLLGLAP